MKRLLSLLVFLGAVSVAKADPITFDVGGGLVLNVPFTQVDALGLWDFRAKQGLAGAETSILSYKKFQFTGGAVTSVEGRGAPFIRTYLLLPNPVGNFASLESLKPGLFIGRDFRSSAYIFGLAASMPIW